MKRTDNFSKFATKKKNSAIKEEFRQEKKKFKKERSEAIEKKKIELEGKLFLQIKEMSELKMTVLQTQMDPHFLYNSLNSINNFVLQNDIEKASDYITKFSRLIREILKNSFVDEKTKTKF